MKIAIDISQAIYGTGVSVYTKNLAASLIKLFPEDQFILFGGSLRRKQELLALAKKLKGIPKIYPFPPNLMDLIWNSLHILPGRKVNWGSGYHSHLGLDRTTLKISQSYYGSRPNSFQVSSNHHRVYQKYPQKTPGLGDARVGQNHCR